MVFLWLETEVYIGSSHNVFVIFILVPLKYFSILSDNHILILFIYVLFSLCFPMT